MKYTLIFLGIAIGVLFSLQTIAVAIAKKDDQPMLAGIAAIGWTIFAVGMLMSEL